MSTKLLSIVLSIVNPVVPEDSNGSDFNYIISQNTEIIERKLSKIDCTISIAYQKLSWYI